MTEERTFTESEHLALLRSEVEREVAQAVEDRDAQIAELEQRNDVLESEKAQIQQDLEKAQQDLEDFKGQVEHEKAVAQRRDERVERVKAAAPHLADDYFTAERTQRWAEMADQDFEALVQDFEGATLAGLSTEEAEELKGLEGKARSEKLLEIRARRAAKGGVETAAFSGGQTPTSMPEGGGEVTSTFGKFLSMRRGESAPATNGS